jgi:predicted AAA+ superfamily ATPase
MNNKKILPRILNIKLPAGQSAFLWGARKTGKTTLLRQQFASAFWIDLLDFDLFLRLSQNPKELRQMIDTQAKKTLSISPFRFERPQAETRQHRSFGRPRLAL